MSAVVPNPTKQIHVIFPLTKVQSAIKQIPEAVKTAKITVGSDTMNFYQFEVSGNSILSLGVYLDISVHYISENVTEITFECRRKLGWIDNFAEISECYKVIVDCIVLISKALRGELLAAKN